ncbi:MAG: exodeoxyribonuclease V subunit gamma [Pseudomonadales bacterium]|nr:exodeoxyribonuclease V subunit gamma [Pseudomonadales bacterium]
MLNVIQSNQMELLVTCLAERIRARPLEPLAPVVILVQSHGMGQWIKHALARSLGIAANIQTCMPAEFIWDLYRRCLPSDLLPEASAFDRRNLTWHLASQFITQTESLPKDVSRYIEAEGDPQLRAFQLAEKLAEVFDEYLLYRPDWIEGWENQDPATPDANHWQADIWRQLRAQITEPHRAALHRSLMSVLADSGFEPRLLPAHISVIGAASLPALQLQTLQAVARHQVVDVYFLNPCEHYWGDIVSTSDLARRSVRQLMDHDDALTDDDYLTIGNPLLSSMGKQGREFLEMLLEADEANTVEDFQPYGADTALQRVKNDILDMSYGGVFSEQGHHGQLSVAGDDQSVAIRDCHSMLREVEVLLDYLLDVISADNTIQTNDIMIMSPDISAYAPYIDSVFRGKLNYTIADVLNDGETPVLAACLQLLRLSSSRVSSNDVLDLIGTEAIARRFEFGTEDQARIRQWIAGTGIRWGLNAASKSSQWELPEDHGNTWAFGLERLLMGYIADSASGVQHGILPYDVESGDGDLLGRFIHLIRSLGQLSDALMSPRPLAEWHQLLLALTSDFFAPEGAEELELQWLTDLLQQQLSNLHEESRQLAVSPAVIQYWLTSEITASDRNSRFLRGGITFATLVPMRSIPFRVVGLLGMNDRDYPRRERESGLNLIRTGSYRKGDRSRRLDDRYLFLEALISAQDHFYVSYQGHSGKDNQTLPPSVLVAEWQDYLTAVFGPDYLQRISQSHPLQPFSDVYYTAGSHFHTYDQTWFGALNNPEPRPEFTDTELDAALPDNLELQQLQRFFANPVRYFFEHSLRVRFSLAAQDMAETETFSPDNLLAYQLRDNALNHLLAGQPLDRFVTETLASGALMNNSLGRSQLQAAVAGAGQLYEDISAAGSLTKLSGEIELPVDGHLQIVSGECFVTLDHRVLSWRSGKQRGTDLLSNRIAQAFASLVLDSPVSSLLINRESGDKIVRHENPPMSPDDARAEMAVWLALFSQGIRSPLPFQPETGLFLLKDKQLKQPDSRAVGSEADDPYFARAFEGYDESVLAAIREYAVLLYSPFYAAASGSSAKGGKR